MYVYEDIVKGDMKQIETGIVGHFWTKKHIFCAFLLKNYCLTFLINNIFLLGSTFGIPDTVMGLTFIAAGVSVPDALSGIAVVKEGHG